MRTTSFFAIIFGLMVLLLSGCTKDPDDEKKPVYLIDFTEYVNASKPTTAGDIKGYIEVYGLTDIAALAKYDIKVYKVKYKTAFEGDSITASGLLAVPISKKNSDAFPMLSYQHCTITTNSESPTYNPQSENTALALYMASTGFIVMIPDYIGYGFSSNIYHPFMIKEYSINAILDFIRASKEFIATEKPCKTNNKLFLSGYSEGGSATLAALSAIENVSRNTDLEVTASACGAGVYDLNAFRSWMVSRAKYDQPYFTGYLLESFTRYANLNIEYDSVYSKKYASLIPGMIDGVKTTETLNAMFGTLHVGELFNDNFEKPDSIYNLNNYYNGLRTVFTENSVPAWTLNSYVKLYYGKNDMWVPNEQSLKIFSEFRTKGSTEKIEIDAMDGFDHKGAAIPTLARSVIWFRSIK